MKIMLATYGSRGDVQPILALAKALKAAGQEILLAAPPENRQWIEEEKLNFYPLGTDVSAFLKGIRKAHNPGAGLKFLYFLRKEVKAQFTSLEALVPWADMVIGASLVFGLASVGQYFGVPYRYVAFCPQLLPSACHPFPVFKRQTLGHCLNRSQWYFSYGVDKFYLTKLINSYRKSKGMPPVPHAWDHILGKNLILASDRVIADKPEDNRVSLIQTGYLHLKTTPPPCPELESFIAEGTAPLYAGFGSMPGLDQAKNIPIFIRAARKNRQRLVIARPDKVPEQYAGARDIFFMGNYPHGSLFPRMKAVIHHGGAGTTATAAKSGVPQIIIPHILDQYYWGEKIRKKKLGPAPIWRSKLTSERLARAVEICLTDDKIMARARQTADQLNQKDSLMAAVKTILDPNFI